MSQNKPLRPLLFLVVLVLLAGVLVLYQRGGAMRSDIVGPLRAAAGDMNDVEVAPAPARAQVGAPAFPARSGAVTPSMRPDLRREFERASDLYVFLQSLLPAARAGEPDAIWLVSRIYDYCAPYAGDPAAYTADTRLFGQMKLRASTAMVAARERVSRRCLRFAPSDRLDAETIFLKRVEAAEAGSLAAEASLLAMGEPLDRSAEYRRNLVDRVQGSGDPEAYVALSTAMGVAASGDDAYSGRVAGNQLAELAWQMAGCRLGLDCGPTGPLMTQYCANGGICSRDGDQDFQTFVYDAAVPRQGAEVVDDMVDSLLNGGGVPK